MINASTRGKRAVLKAMATKAKQKINVKNRTLFITDNMNVLRGMNSECVDLVYLDPPFNSNRNYAAPIGSKAAGAAFKDTWTYNDVDQAYFDDLEAKDPVLYSVINTAGVTYGNDMKSYLIMMALRLFEIQRILKPSGSVYLHCDPTASHYLKILLDRVFGAENFRNEIIWAYSGPANVKRWFPRKHDCILFYSKNSEVANFNSQYTKHKSGIHNTGTVFGKQDGDSEKIREREKVGKLIEDWWADIGSGAHISKKERTGYPTQKPLALLERIVKASSAEGDIVLDPFCGCATALVAAERLNRQWIGIDISPTAARLTVDRMRDEADMFNSKLNNIIVKKGKDARLLRSDMEDEPEMTAKYKTESRKTLYVKQNGSCRGCEERFDLRHFHLDHITPRNESGSNKIENLQLLCGACNSIKGARDMKYLRARLAQLKRAEEDATSTNYPNNN